MDSLWQDIRFGLRTLVKNAAFSLVIVLTLALGLGANAAIFASIDALIFRPFPMADADRIVMVGETTPTRDWVRESVSPANYLDWKAQSDAFEMLAASEWWDVNLSGRDEPERVQGFFVSADFFRIMDARPAIGRDFVRDDEQVGRQHQVIVGYGLWQRRFAGDPAIVGQTILLDATPYTVVGIAPEGFDFPIGCEIWAPLAFDPRTAAVRHDHYLTVVGRLKAAGSLAGAQAQMRAIGERLAQQYPESNRRRGARVVTLTEGMMDEGAGPFLAAWQVAALFVLLIGCANVANLLLARGAERQREMAVRLAMGATRGDLVRQLLVESVVLAMAAVPVSILLARVALDALRSAMPANIARFVAGWREIDVDGRLVLVTVLVAFATAIVFGLLPALQVSRPALAESLKEGARSATASPRRQRLRQVLVAGQIALALALLVATGLSLAATLKYLYGPQGYDPDNVLVMRLVLPEVKYRDEEARRQFTDRVLDRLRALPGAEDVAATNVIPAGGNNWTRTIAVEGQAIPDPTNQPSADYRTISADYFRVMRIPLVRGRAFTASDHEQSLPVAIVSRALADRHWPGRDPLGKRLKLGTGDGPWLMVVGVVGDVVHDWFARRGYPTAYVPLRQAPPLSVVLAARTSGIPDALAQPARAAVRAVDPDQPLFLVMSMRRQLKERTIGLQYASSVMGVLGVLALVLAAVGVYSLMTYLIVQRTHEIGVRVALGASRRDVLWLTLGQALRMTAAGLGLGLVLGVLVSRLMAGLVPGMAAAPPWMFASVAGGLGLVALVAGYVPSLRALRVDPIIALRSE